MKNNEKLEKQFLPYNAYLDAKGIIRCNSRLAHLDHLPYDTRYPILLPKEADFTKLLVTRAHLKLEHAVGIGTAKGFIRKKFIVFGLENLLKNIRKDCLGCKRRRTNPSQQQMSALPEYRFTEPLSAFAKIGLDFCGPFDIRVGRGKVRIKSYILVITCLQTRAIHLEPTNGMSAEDFIKALQRFVSIRGVPIDILSDNWSSFVHVEKELEHWVQNLPKDWIVEQTPFKVTWHFTPPKGPHHGGIYETMVKSTKRAIKAICGERFDLDMDEFRTLTYQVMALVNSRPLTRVNTEDNNAVEILTPNSFLHSNLGGAVIPQDANLSLKNRVTKINKLLNHFWRQYFLEYVPELRTRRKWGQVSKDLEVGEVVLEMNEDFPRGMWKMAVVTKIYPSKDAKVRKCQIKTSDGLFDRPIAKLCPLDIKCKENFD